jgi:CheY-like chemotaxis protein
MSVLLDDATRSGARPLVLVAEDQPFLRESTVRMLDRQGLSAIAVGSVQQAVTALEASPRVDVALLDIHLVNDKEIEDKGGIEIARLLRKAVPEIRIIGYSGRFHENDLSSEELGLFDQSLAKGRLTREDHEELWRLCVTYGRDSYFERRLKAVEQYEYMRREYENDYPRIEVLRRFQMEDADSEQLTAEGALGMAGFKIRLVRMVDPGSGLSSNPFVLWQQETIEDGVKWFNLEAYGWPEVYASAHTEDEALVGMTLYMSLIRQDIQDSEQVEERDLALLHFLDSILIG